MSRSYYVIELSARWLTVLLVGLAVLMVLAFGLGYGAAHSVGGNGPGPVSGEPTSTPVVQTEVIPDPTVPAQPPAPTRPAATPTPRPAPPDVAPPKVTPTVPPATATPKPRPTKKPAGGFWVQILASSTQTSIDEAGTKLVGLGFDREHQKVVRAKVAGGNELIKLRVGPFPDRASADRVLQRMRTADFPDAWVVVP